MTFCIGRREFIALLGGAAAVWPLEARLLNIPMRFEFIGLLGGASPKNRTAHSCRQFQRGIGQSGWT